MSNNQPPDRELLPSSNNRPPSYPLDARGQFGLGRPLLANGEETADDDVINLRDLWRMVAKHRWLLVSVAVVGLLAALLISFIRTPVYQAVTTLQVDKRAASVVKFGQQDLDTGAELDDRTSMGTQLELLKSRVLAERVIGELRLDRSGMVASSTDASPGSADDADEQSSWFSRLKANWGKVREPAMANEQKLSRESVFRAFQEAVRSEQVRNTRMLKVSVDNPDPQLAARIANTVAQSFIALNLERRMEASSYAKTFLEEQLTLTKAKLEESERRLNDYARERGIVTLDQKTNAVNQTFTEYSTALVKAEQERIKFDSIYQAIKGAPHTAREVLENHTIQEYKAQRSKLEAEYQQQSKVFKENFPTMVQLKAQMKELDAKIAAEVNSILRSVANQLATAQRQEALIRSRLAQTQQEIMQGQDRQVDYNLLKREVDTNRELYDGLLQQVKEVGVAGGVETNNIQVVDKAQTPLFPYKPKIPLNAAIGLLAGLVLGLALVFLIESFDDSIKLTEDVEKSLALPLLGVIPQVKEKKGSTSLAFMVHRDPRGLIAEAYRSTRTALQFSSPTGAPKALLITSTTKNEGKSTTALALAISFAQLGGKVALIDADMRNPTVHKLFKMRNAYGLSSYLSGQKTEGAFLRRSIVPNLSVVTAGPTPPNPVDLLMGPHFGDLLARLQERGYHVIVDAPPVLGLADAIVLSNQIPAVLYVAQASLTRLSHIKNALNRMRMAGIVPRGVVLTKTTPHNSSYFAYDGYYGEAGAQQVQQKAKHAIQRG